GCLISRPNAFPRHGSLLLQRRSRPVRCLPDTCRKTAGRNSQAAPAHFFFHPENSSQKRRPAAAAVTVLLRPANGTPDFRRESRSSGAALRRSFRQRPPRCSPRALFHPRCIWSFLREGSERRLPGTAHEPHPFSDRFLFRFG